MAIISPHLRALKELVLDRFWAIAVLLMSYVESELLWDIQPLGPEMARKGHEEGIECRGYSFLCL